MQQKNVFVKGRMNKDIDERLLPAGEYPHAENVRVIDAGDAHLGAVENDLGNLELVDLGVTNAVTIGALADQSNQKLYYFVTSDEKDVVVEYDVLNESVEILLESSNPDGVLNFSPNYLITGINKIINEDSSKDMLAWTDDRNPPRIINIDRAKTYAVDGFAEDDIAVIKKPPVFAPTLTPVHSADLTQNNLENKFLSFAYRFRYLDGGYSAISPYTYYYFTPSKFSVDYNVLENLGMVNSFNSVKIEFNTGDERVTDVELVVKASNSNTVYIIDRFNKKGKGWADDAEQSYTFSNSKLYIALPEAELSRSFDNVPRLAKAQDLVGNRLVYGNFLENYNIVDFFAEDIIMDYTPSIFSRNLTGLDVPVTLSTSGTAGTNDEFNVDFTGIELLQGRQITFYVLLNEQTYEDGIFQSNMSFVLDQDYDSVADLAASQAFIDFVELTMTNIFETNYQVTSPPPDSVVQNLVGFLIDGVVGDVLTITAPHFEYLINDTPPAVVSYWGFDETTTTTIMEEGSNASLKSNRSYEVGIIYKDAEGRATTVLTSQNNTIHIPHAKAINQNKIRVNVAHKPPYWADRYTFAIKQNKDRYLEVYANTFYEDGVYRWIKLEGTNKDKVKVNDNLILKSDLTGYVQNLYKIRVLDIVDQPEDFIEGNLDNNGNPVLEQSGLYMKIKPPVGVNIDYKDDSFISITDSRSHKVAPDGFRINLGYLSTEIEGVFVDNPVVQGSQIRIYLSNTKFGSAGFDYKFDQTFIAGADYDSFEDWFNTEVPSTAPFNDIIFEHGYVNSSTNPDNFDPDPLGPLYMRVRNIGNGNGQHPSYLDGVLQINKNTGLLIFETDPLDKPDDLFFEASETFMIENGFHKGNIQDQEGSVTGEAICELDYYNCFCFGNGAESNSYRSAFNTNWVNIDLRPSTVTIEKYKENRRYADLTYSNTYNEGTGINGLNEFNLSTANFKDDLEKKYGSIQKIWSRDTDLLVMQEDKISRVLFGKAVLNNADGSGNIGKVQDVLGQQVTYVGEYGISLNPESFAIYADAVYFTDTKRGTPLRLSGPNIEEINPGLRNYFKDTMRANTHSKKVGAYDPFNDQYNLYVEGPSINPDAKIDCSQTIKRSQFSGRWRVYIDFGVALGDAGFSFTSNEFPIQYVFTWDGVEVDTGFRGSSEYDDELAALGLPAVEGPATGSVTFEKNLVSPTIGILDIYAPLGNTNVEISGNCVVTPALKVINVITNDSSDVGKTIDSRFRWSNDGYESPYKHYLVPFDEDGITVFEQISGFEGVGFLPSDGAVVNVDSYQTFGSSGVFDNLDRLGYLVSDVLYTEAEVEDIMIAATFLSKTETVFDNGDKLVRGTFTFDRLGKQYLYLIWDYNTPPLAIDDFTNCEPGSSVVINILANDEGNLEGFFPQIVDAPLHGMAIVNLDGTVTYTNNGDPDETDSFTYKLSDGFEESNVATVSLTVALPCSGSFSQTGGPGSFSLPISFGLGTGECGIAYNAFTIPDQFEIVWDGDVVATTGGLVSGTGTLTFIKTTPLPTTATIVVSAPTSGTVWELSGICPLASPTARLERLKISDLLEGP